MTKGEAKQWLDGAIEAHEQLAKYAYTDGVKLSTNILDTLTIREGFDSLAEALGAIVTANILEVRGELMRIRDFEYRNYRISEVKAVGAGEQNDH